MVGQRVDPGGDVVERHREAPAVADPAVLQVPRGPALLGQRPRRAAAPASRRTPPSRTRRGSPPRRPRRLPVGRSGSAYCDGSATVGDRSALLPALPGAPPAGRRHRTAPLRRSAPRQRHPSTPRQQASRRPSPRPARPSVADHRARGRAGQDRSGRRRSVRRRPRRRSSSGPGVPPARTSSSSSAHQLGATSSRGQPHGPWITAACRRAPGSRLGEGRARPPRAPSRRSRRRNTATAAAPPGSPAQIAQPPDEAARRRRAATPGRARRGPARGRARPAPYFAS